jgi:hypothetical protein
LFIDNQNYSNALFQVESENFTIFYLVYSFFKDLMTYEWISVMPQSCYFICKQCYQHNELYFSFKSLVIKIKEANTSQHEAPTVSFCTALSDRKRMCCGCVHLARDVSFCVVVEWMLRHENVNVFGETRLAVEACIFWM